MPKSNNNSRKSEANSNSHKGETDSNSSKERILLEDSADAFSAVYVERVRKFLMDRYMFNAKQVASLVELVQKSAKIKLEDLGDDKVKNILFPLVKKFWEDKVNEGEWVPPQPHVQVHHQYVESSMSFERKEVAPPPKEPKPKPLLHKEKKAQKLKNKKLEEKTLKAEKKKLKD